MEYGKRESGKRESGKREYGKRENGPSSSKCAIDTLWVAMNSEKGDLISRTENYARLSIPYICPPCGSEDTEQTKGHVMIGARLVNHLANKVVDTMFPHDRPFFTVGLKPETRRRLRDELGPDKEAEYTEQVRKATSQVEQEAVRTMDLVSYRPQAVEAVKHMQIAGNVLILRCGTNKRVVYGIKDFCIRRDITGEPREIILRDAKKFNGLSEDLQAKVLDVHPTTSDTDDMVLYSHYVLIDERWHFRQAVNSVVIDNQVRFTPVDMPVLALTWNLARGANYGRGIIEDEITSFHNIDVTTLALIDMIGVMADVKFLVDPASLLDVGELNASPRGSFHVGREGDITTPTQSRTLEIGVLRDIIQSWERELAQAFLLSSSAVRQAERVTAEEIRYVANELEQAFGGLYSRLSIEWQKHEADYAVSKINFDKDIGGKLSMFEVVVTTGLESLSREGQLANLRGAIQDLQMLEAVPQEIRNTVNPLKFAAFVFTNHTVNMAEFMFTAAEIQANSDAQMQQQQQLADVQANANVKQAAGEQAVQGTP